MEFGAGGEGGRRRFKREGMYVNTCIAGSHCVQWKPTQHCKVIILQFKKKREKSKQLWKLHKRCAGKTGIRKCEAETETHSKESRLFNNGQTK